MDSLKKYSKEGGFSVLLFLDIYNMKHFKLFEEFNPYSGSQFIDKLKIYADASPYAKKVTEIKANTGSFSFEIETSIPADFGDQKGVKSFKVTVPTNMIDVPYVDTYENGKLVLHTTLEIKGENEIDLLLLNFIEATALYNDGSIQDIIDAHKTIKTSQDITQIINTLG